MDINDVIGRLLFGLHASDLADLAWWNQAELIAWVDEAVKRVSRTTGLFVVFDTTIQMATGQAQYSLPAGHIATLYVFHNGLPLIPTSSSQIELVDANWQSAAPGLPVRYIEDKIGLNQISLYPPPDAGNAAKQLGIVHIKNPPSLDTQMTQTTVAWPVPMDDYAQAFTLSRALRHDSDGQVMEVANHLAERAALYEAIAADYWAQ